jgi:hypothetical protein
MNKTNCALGVLAALLLAACGGGGSAPADTPASKLAPYMGKWVHPCYGYQLASLTMSEAAGVEGGVTIVNKSEYFQRIGCSGAVVATETYSTNTTATYTSSSDTSLSFAPGAAGVSTRIDHFTLSSPAYRSTLTGSGVTHPVTNGQAEWCIAFADTTSPMCFEDDIEPADASFAISFYVKGNKLHILQPNTSGGHDVIDAWVR